MICENFSPISCLAAYGVVVRDKIKDMKKWYAAHLIEYAKFRDGVQDYYPFYENVVLIEADSPEEAWDKAEQFGKDNEFDDTSLT